MISSGTRTHKFNIQYPSLELYLFGFGRIDSNLDSFKKLSNPKNTVGLNSNLFQFCLNRCTILDYLEKKLLDFFC